ncbi:MAG: hypothetical protein HYV27_24325 [Candidatus Hydrogenedentes bacterium]|nr:hypothetical protein [Candidatus Hydrogenedentota bacterium]
MSTFDAHKAETLWERLLTGELTPEERADLDLCLAEAPAPGPEWASLAALDRALDELGSQVAAEAPVVDMEAEVARQLAAYKAGGRALEALSSPDDVTAMAYVEGALDELSRVRFENRLSHNPALLRETSAIKQLHDELIAAAAPSLAGIPEIDIVADVLAKCGCDSAAITDQSAFHALEMELAALGESLTQQHAQVDLVGAVMGQVAARKVAKAVPTRVAPFPKDAAKPAAVADGAAALRWRWAAAAAFVVCGLAAWQGWNLVWQSGGSNSVAVAPEARDHRDLIARTPDKDLTALHPIPENSLLIGEPAVEETPAEPARAAITLQDALQARRAALLKNPSALEKLTNWMSLTEEEARALLDDLDALSRKALLGALEFLPAEEAIEILEGLIERNPEDPTLRYALLEKMPLDEKNAAAYQQHLTAWAELDPDNSLPHIMEANMHFALGHTDSALNALTRAAGYGSATSYALEDAQEREEALVANGMDRDVARLLIASAWGVDEYTQMTSFGQQLLEQGAYYASQGDYATAEEIYNAARQFGVQVTAGAAFINEQAAGVDIQMEAVQALSEIYDILDSAETQALLGQDLQQLMTTFADVSNLLISYNALFETGNLDYVMNIANLVFQFGNVNLDALQP